MGQLQDAIQAFAPLMTAERILTLDNAELRRMMIEAVGHNALFQSAQTTLVHTDLDEQGNPRALLHLPCEDALGGILAACRVVCPTTGRVYHLLVDPQAKTCQAAVDGTFQVVGQFVARHT